MDPFKEIDYFEQELAEYTGSPYAVVLDCCTHAIELSMRYDRVSYCEFSAYTYLSVNMIFHQLKIPYKLVDDRWEKNYQYHHTRIWDYARCFEANMYQPGTLTCVSFGRGKPLEIGHGGAVLLDDPDAYRSLKLQAYDGRDLSIAPWQDQKVFNIGYHYKLSPDFCKIGREKLAKQEFNTNQFGWEGYPDTRLITIKDN